MAQIVITVALSALCIVSLIIVAKDIKATAEEMGGGSKVIWQSTTPIRKG